MGSVCRSTHYEGCACHEQRHRDELAAKDATIAALREEVERLKAENAKLTRADDEARKLCYDLAARLGNAGARATTAERQLEAYKEAVRVLGVEVRKSRGMKGPDKYWDALEHVEAIKGVNANPIASSAVRGEQQPSGTDEPEQNKPIGNCHRCGVPVYIDGGFCGGCKPSHH